MGANDGKDDRDWFVYQLKSVELYVVFAILLRHDFNDYIMAQPPLAWDLFANVNNTKTGNNILGRSSMPE